MPKKVIYNGGTMDYGPRSSDPKDLVRGHVYTLVGKEVYDWYTFVHLKEVPGQFNSVWFDEIDQTDDGPQTYLGTTRRVPIEGQRLHDVYRFDEFGNVTGPWSTSNVKSVVECDGDVYLVHTMSGNTYILKLLD